MSHTPSKSAEQTELQLADVLESVGDAFFILDKDFVFVLANRAYEKLSHISREDTIGQNIWDVFPMVANQDSPFWINYHTVVEQGKPVSFTYFNDRAMTWLEVNAYPTSAGGASVFIRDVTAKLDAERALSDSEQRFRALVSATSDVIYRMSPDWIEMRQLDGRDFLADTGTVDRNWIEKYIPESERPRVWRTIHKAIESKGIFQLEHPVYQADGSVGWTFSRAIPILDDSGNITEWFGAASDVTERRRQLETEQRMQMLTEQRNALIKINETKDEFIALASHQLRTPATAVKQYIGMLLGSFVGTLTPEQTRFLQIAYDSNERELRIINDLLQTAQIDGTMPDRNMIAESYDIVALTQDVIQDLKATVDRRGQLVSLTASERPITVYIDVTEMKLAISNLIENASKYSHPDTEIKVDLKTAKSTVTLSVIDSGIGISGDDQQKIFQKFTRGTNVISDTVTGTGLGLYWVKQITEIHGGSIKLVSTLGKGSTFTMKLPLAAK